jgi:hypothetical protein
VNRDDKQYLSEISKVNESQIREEQMMTITNSKKKLLNIPNIEQDDNSYELSIKYNKAYNKWKDLSQQEKEKIEWKKDITSIKEG